MESLDAGPFGPAARRFLSEHPGAPRGATRGADGLRALADAVDAWAEREESALDDPFVEGAGALLALILLDHVGEGGHVSRGHEHRLRLGRHGFFDPFGAVERALEAEDARAALALEVRRAEAEARGEAGMGRALPLLREALARARPALSIESSFGAEVRLSDAVTIDLRRTLRATEGLGEEAERSAIEKLVSMLPRAATGQATLEEVGGRLLPRLVAPGFAASLEGRSRLAAERRAGGALEVALAVDHGDRSRFLRQAELERWGLSFDEALRRALSNLAARSERARFARVETPAGPLVVARTGDGLDASRLLLPTLPEVLGPELGPAFLAAVPHRDVLLACRREAAAREALEGRARRDAARAPHPITARIFGVSARGLEPA